MPQGTTIATLAAACAARVSAATSTDSQLPGPEFQALLEEIRHLDPRFAFERDGRADAVAAIRSALPSVERDLLEAVIEDHTCEVAALHEAIFQIVRACAGIGSG